MTVSDINLVMDQLNLPANLTQTQAITVNIQGMDIIIGLLTVIMIFMVFILRYQIKRTG